jgi:hypothetical protein
MLHAVAIPAASGANVKLQLIKVHIFLHYKNFTDWGNETSPIHAGTLHSWSAVLNTNKRKHMKGIFVVMTEMRILPGVWTTDVATRGTEM